MDAARPRPGGPGQDQSAALDPKGIGADHPDVRRGEGRSSAAVVRRMPPEGMPSWMLITHNALEFLFTPGRVTVWANPTATGFVVSIQTAGRIRTTRIRPSMAIP